MQTGEGDKMELEIGGQKIYPNLDIDKKKKPAIVGDVQSLPIKSNSIDFILCENVLEHVPDVQRAVKEIHRVLKPGGKAEIVTPFMHAEHGNDYWRFTKRGLKYLFRDFSFCSVETLLGYFEGLILHFPQPFHFLRYLARFFDRRLHLFEENSESFRTVVKK